MRSGMKWLFALAMFMAVPTGCFTEAPVPQDEANEPALSTEEQPLEEALRCPGGLVDCCGDGTCTLPQVCRIIQCEGDAPKLVEEIGSESYRDCPDGLIDCCGDGVCIPVWACTALPHDCPDPGGIP